MASMMCAEEVAYSEIKQRILDGRLAPGARLVHRTLAKELGMSSVPLVLALRMLERDGLVVNTPGLGACVRRWTKEEIIDIYHVRSRVEGLASCLCAQRATNGDMEAIVKCDELFRESAIARNVETNSRADMEFHMAVVRGAHCADLERLIENLSIMKGSMSAFSVSLGVPRLFFQGGENVHKPIVTAIKRRDPEAAERAGKKHVEDSLARNLKWIEQTSTALQNEFASRPRWSSSHTASAVLVGASG